MIHEECVCCGLDRLDHITRALEVITWLEKTMGINFFAGFETAKEYLNLVNSMKDQLREELPVHDDKLAAFISDVVQLRESRDSDFLRDSGQDTLSLLHGDCPQKVCVV